MLGNLRKHKFPGTTRPYLSVPNFDGRVYQSNGGEVHGCKDSGWLNIDLKGSMSSGIRFGYGFVGTISPSLRLEEVHRFFHSNPRMDARLSFDGKGILDIDHYGSLQRELLSSPITDFEPYHPSIISFSPQLNADISIVGQGEIDAKFTMHFETASGSTLMTNAPLSIREFGGSALYHTTIRDPVSSDV